MALVQMRNNLFFFTKHLSVHAIFEVEKSVERPKKCTSECWVLCSNLVQKRDRHFICAVSYL